MQHRACHCCGQIHEVPALKSRQRAQCVRCGAVVAKPPSHASSRRTAAAACAALVLFFPAISLPMLEIEKLGHHHSSSLLTGIWELFEHGSWFVASVVLLFSVVFPLTKIVLLLELSMLGIFQQRHRALTYRMMEQAGKWSMMDVLLLAFMVMLVKLGNLVNFHIGSAVIAFVGCVTMSMIASLSFDPHSIWDEPAP